MCFEAAISFNQVMWERTLPVAKNRFFTGRICVIGALVGSQVSMGIALPLSIIESAGKVIIAVGSCFVNIRDAAKRKEAFEDVTMNFKDVFLFSVQTLATYTLGVLVTVVMIGVFSWTAPSQLSQVKEGVFAYITFILKHELTDFQEKLLDLRLKDFKINKERMFPKGIDAEYQDLVAREEYYDRFPLRLDQGIKEQLLASLKDRKKNLQNIHDRFGHHMTTIIGFPSHLESKEEKRG
ncbi:MAG: hypothetical protein H0X51_07255 [Parachlamydiaceae bacterium]|nr:hypothetical protein [Parachlamydiaceae bacterium]